MSGKWWMVLIGALLVLGAAGGVSARVVRVYYVDPAGDDSADGLSEATAFRTIMRALEVVEPGDNVAILPGVYTESLMLEDLGDDSAWIRIYGQDEGVILDGLGELALGLWCENCAFIMLGNLTIRNYTDIGVGVSYSETIALNDLTVQHNGFAVQLDDWEIEGYGIHVEESRDVVVEDCDVFENGPQPQTSDLLMGTGINTYRCVDCVIVGNEAHDNIGGGVLVEDGENVIVRSNEIYGNDLDATADGWWDGAIWIDGGNTIYVRYNNIYDNVGPGIQISDEDNQQPTGYVIEENTITGNIYGIYLWNFGTTDWPPMDIVSQSDNVIVDNIERDIWIVDWECPPSDPCD